MSRRGLALGWLFCIVSFLPAADTPPTDLKDYRTVDQAQTTELKRTVGQAIAQGHLGIGVEMDKGKLTIVRVQPGSAAETAGVKVGDVLKSLDGQVFANVDSLRQYLVLKQAGQSIVLNIERESAPVTITVQLVSASNPMREAGLPPVIGVQLNEAHHGVLIEEVTPGSPAETAGIKAGDVVTRIDTNVTANRDDLRKCLADHKPGDKVKLAVLRPMVVPVTLFASSTSTENAGQKRPALGVQLIETKRGVLIDRVTAGSPADKAGLKIGDVICRFNDSATNTLEEFRARIAERKLDETVQVAFVRNHQPQELAVELAAAPPAGPDELPSLSKWDDRNPRTFRRSEYKLAVIPIAYPDMKPNEKLPTSVWETALFSTGQFKGKSPTGQTVYGSMNDYYQEISYGKFKIEGKVFEPVTVGKKRSEYLQTSSKTALLTEACDQLIKRDGDDCLKGFDGIFFLYSGGRIQTQRTGIYWPHRASFSYKGKRWAYFICPEGGDRMASISVACHEFGHMLGLPDLYFKAEAPDTQGLGIWCTMSVGHGRDGKPLHFSAWCKDQLGWIKPIVIDPRVKQKLILSPNTHSNREFLKVVIRPDGSEYLLIENRAKKGFDADLPAEGLLIWRVVDGRPNLEVSHGITTPDGPSKFLGSVPYPSRSNRSFTPSTTPSSRPTKPGGYEVHITDIRRLDDGRVTFQIGYEYF